MSSIQSFYFVGVITLVSSAHVYGQKKDKMNVLFIIADDMRPELGWVSSSTRFLFIGSWKIISAMTHK